MNSLYTAQTGLSAARYSVDTTSNNIANENTQGYKKRVVETSEISLLNSGQTGHGVSFDGVTRSTSAYLYQQLVNQSSLESYYEQENSILSNVEMMFSETDTSGFSITLSNFFDSIETLRSEPDSLIYQNELATQSDVLVNSLQTMYSNLEEAQTSNLELLNQQVGQVNTILEQITYLNEKMIQSNSVANDLLDKRDQLELELSSLVNIDVDTSNGNYVLKVGDTTAILNNKNLHELSVIEEYTAQKDIYTTTDLDDANVADGQTVTLTLNNGTTLSFTASTSGATPNELKQQIVDTINTSSDFSLLNASLDSSNNLIITSVEEGEVAQFDLTIRVDEVEIEKSNNSIEASNSISVAIYGNDVTLQSGSIKALTENLTTSTSKISQYKQSLDDFAKALVEMTGNTTSTQLFSGSSVNSLAFTNNISDLSTKDLDTLAQIQWNTNINIDSSSSETTSFSKFYQQFLVTVSSDVENNAFKLESQEAIVNSLSNAHDNLTKVDPDEEMINLLQYQAAYEANAKVITIVDEMLQTLLNM